MPVKGILYLGLFSEFMGTLRNTASGQAVHGGVRRCSLLVFAPPSPWHLQSCLASSLIATN